MHGGRLVRGAVAGTTAVTEATALLMFASATLLLAALVAYLLAGFRPNWGIARIAWLAPLPVPALALFASALIGLRVATASKGGCGVDACGIASIAAAMLAICAIVLYLAAAIIAYVIVRRRRR